MKTRVLIIAAAAASATLVQVPAANAERLCEDVAVTGIVNANPPAVCVPLVDATCSSGAIGQPSVLLVSNTICIPTIITGP